MSFDGDQILITVGVVDATPISVRLLGGFSMRFGDLVLGQLPPQTVSILSYLIVNRERPQTRDLLAGRFWSELPEDRARKRLSNALWQIKNAAAETGFPPPLEATSSSVEVTRAHPIELDAEHFESQLIQFERELRSRQVRGAMADRLSEMIAGYEGDFLAGHYDDWIELERSRIRDLYHNALGQLVSLYKGRSQYDKALQFATAQVDQEPLQEKLHREVMRLQALLGQPTLAERQFEKCRQELQSELGVEPSAETIELLERIQADAPSLGVQVRSAGPEDSQIVGRIRELGVLMGRVDELIAGDGGVVLLEGDPGIGKSRLVEEVVDGAEWRNVRVLTAGHTELSPMRPYETLRDALAPSIEGIRAEHLAETVEPVWLRQAAEVFPELEAFLDGDGVRSPLRPEEESIRKSEALARIILAQGGLGPTMIVLEDIHWCDDDSMQVLAQLGNRLVRSQVLLCLTYRRFEAEQSASVWSGIGQLEALPSGSRLVVGPLNDAEVRELVARRAGPAGMPAGLTRQLAAQTGGNPLFVLESLRQPAELSDGEGRPAIGDLELPTSIAEALERRIATLRPELLQVLQGLATLAEPASTQLAAEVAGLDRRSTLEALHDAVDQGLVVNDEGLCRFSHDQTRRSVYEMGSAADRQDRHHRIYEVLAGVLDPKPEQLAYHARLAERWHDAHRWYLISAREAVELGGLGTAADHYGQADQAAQEAGLDLAARASDLLEFEQVLDTLGRRSDQTDLLKHLRGVDLPFPIELELARREAWLLLNTDKPDEAIALARRNVELAKQVGEPYDQLLVLIGTAHSWSGDLANAIEPLREALATTNDPLTRIDAETELGKVLVIMTEDEAGEQHLKAALDSSKLMGDLRRQIEALGLQAVVRARVGRFDEASAIFESAIELSRSIGYRRGEGVNLVNLAANLVERGREGRALLLYNQAAEVLGSFDYGRGEAVVKMNEAELNHKLFGDDAAALELATSAAVFFRSTGDRTYECHALCTLSSIDRRARRFRRVRRRTGDMLERSVADADQMSELWTRSVLARLELDVGDGAAAGQQLDRLLEIADERSQEQVIPGLMAFRGLAYLQQGDLDAAVRWAERASAAMTTGSEEAHIVALTCADIHAAAGNYELATEHIQSAKRLLDRSLEDLSDQLVQAAWTAVPDHLRIAEEYGRRFARTIRLSLPDVDAPLGRPLTVDELIEVEWTASAPADWQIESAAERRQARVLRLVDEALAAGAVARVADLAEILEVSERTIKRDLADLRENGHRPHTRRST